MVAVKTEQIKVLSHTTHHKKQHFTWVGKMLRDHLARMQPSLGPEASCPGTTRQGDRIREPASPTGDAYLRPKSQSTTKKKDSISY